MEHYIFQNTGSGEFGNAQGGGGGTDLESWNNGYTEGTSDGWTDGFTEGTSDGWDNRAQSISPTSFSFGDFVYPGIRDAASNISLYSAVNISNGNSVFNSYRLKPGQTLNGCLFNVNDSNTDGTVPVNLNVVAFVTGIDTSNGGLGFPWGSADIPLFEKNTLAKGTSTVSVEYSSVYSTTGTVLFETPLTTTVGTTIYINTAGDIDTIRFPRRVQNATLAMGTTTTYGTSISYYITSWLIKPLVEGLNIAPDLTITSGTSGAFKDTSAPGALIVLPVGGTVDGIYTGSFDIDYNGHFIIMDTAGSILGTTIEYSNVPNTSSTVTNKKFLLENSIEVLKDQNIIITGTTNSSTGNIIRFVPFQDDYLKSISSVSDSTMVWCQRNGATYDIVGTNTKATLDVGVTYTSINIAK